jgi:hypothetical protein
MKTLPVFSLMLALICMSPLAREACAQTLPGSLGFTIEGSFVNGTAEGSRSILIADNDLTDGYVDGFDVTDAPAALASGGPEGSAAFQWGQASGSSDYPHASALWFQPLTAQNLAPEQTFELGYLFYRNGTIKGNTGATWVDLALCLSFSQPLGQDPASVVFGSQLINTTNTSDPVGSADIVSLRDQSAPLDFTDASGNRYFMELTFQVDEDTLDGTLSTQDEFRVFEGSRGRAVLLGRFTTSPIDGTGIPSIPEPSAAAIGALGVFFLLRRKR